MKIVEFVGNSRGGGGRESDQLFELLDTSRSGGDRPWWHSIWQQFGQDLDAALRAEFPSIQKMGVGIIHKWILGRGADRPLSIEVKLQLNKLGPMPTRYLPITYILWTSQLHYAFNRETPTNTSSDGIDSIVLAVRTAIETGSVKRVRRMNEFEGDAEHHRRRIAAPPPPPPPKKPRRRGGGDDGGQENWRRFVENMAFELQTEFGIQYLIGFYAPSEHEYEWRVHFSPNKVMALQVQRNIQDELTDNNDLKVYYNIHRYTTSDSGQDTPWHTSDTGDDGIAEIVRRARKVAAHINRAVI